MLSDNNKLNEIYSLLTNVNKTAYKNKYLLSNQILNKNINNFYIDKEWECKEKGGISLLKVPLHLSWYYIKSFGNLLLFLLECVAYKMSGQGVSLDEINKDSICIDTFLNIEDYEKDGVFYDKYFHGLYDVLTSCGIKYYFIPKFYNKYNKKFNIFTIYRMFIFFRKHSVPVISHYQLTTFKDILESLVFILVYPIFVIRTFMTWKTDSKLSKALKYELLFDINRVRFNSFQQYLYGKHISNLSISKVISWFENQTTDKNLYAGLRNGGGNTFIYGCQLYVYSSEILSIKVDPSEIDFRVVPDKVLVNGRHYLIEDNDVNSSVGPSFRYHKIFDDNLFMESPKKTKVLVLLPYYDREIIYIINLINSICDFEESLHVKFHPAVSIFKYKKLLLPDVVITNDDLYDLFKTTKIVIGSATGSMVEAACCSIPSIVIKNIDGISLNYFDDYGEGVIWDYAEDIYDIMRLLKKYNHSLCQNNGNEKIKECAIYYKDNFFSKPTKDLIINAFDLQRV